MSFNRILRSSALMGGAQVVVLAVGFVRAKVIALILGASGVGLIGIFSAFSGNVSALAGWGLGTSGVRLVSGAAEEERAGKIAAVRRMGWILSLVGLGVGIVSFAPVGLATFDSHRYALELAIVALAVPCVIASSAWSALLQASGKIASLAKVQVASACTGLLVGLPAIYFWGTVGIAVSIFLAAAVPAAVLWRAASTECPARAGAAVEARDLRQLVKVGGALMIVGWVGQLSAYLVRLAIVRQEGLDAAGYYQAAYAISGSLPGFVFSAMGADFFPRVSAAKNEEEARHITEKQIQAALLLGVPLIVTIVTLGRSALSMLYADGFDPAFPLLQWMAWGIFLRLITWPIGFWLLARGSSLQLILVESAAAVIATVLPCLLLPHYGLVSAAFAFFLSNVAHGIIIFCALGVKSGFAAGKRTIIWVTASTLAIVVAQWWAGHFAGSLLSVLPMIGVSTICACMYWRELRLR
jgi:PST family polysaccharide transporter